MKQYYKKCEEIKKLKECRNIEFEYVKKLENEMVELKRELKRYESQDLIK